jgi:parallel beta-helix repeat protein
VGGLIEDSEFSGTNGTSPEGGIDLEPISKGIVAGITIRNCVVMRNAGRGMLLCGNDIYGGTVTRVLVESNTLFDNGLDGITVMRGSSECTVRGNTIMRNMHSGVRLDGASNNEVSYNILADNSRESPRSHPSILLVNSSSYNFLKNNTFRDTRPWRLIRTAGPDIYVAESDCLGNIINGEGETSVLEAGTRKRERS